MIDQFLQTHLERYVEETVRLCAQPSISAHGGDEMHECAALVAETLRAHGLETHIIPTPTFPIVVGKAQGASPRTLLFYNHYDVQPVDPLELWTTPPFEPQIRDGKLFARGAKDDKGELVARLAALDAVRAAHGGRLPCGVTFVVEGEEEVGSPNIRQFVLDHLELLKCDGAVWEEGNIDSEGHPGDFLGCRGVAYVELHVRTLKMDAHSGSAHALPNAAWRLVQALASLKDADERVLIPGFYDHVRPPSKRDLELIDALPSYEKFARQHFGVQRFVHGALGKAIEYNVFQPTCNICGLKSGYQDDGSKTVIPATAMAKVDFRLVPDQDPNDILAKLRAYLDAQGFGDVEVVKIEESMWPYKAEADHPLLDLSARMGEEVYGKPSLFEALAGGSSPVYAFAKPLGNIPVISPGVGYWANRTHSPDEHIRIGDFHNAARHIARILDGFADL
ncbi:MAG: M20/M25/M40 family metallo-hydrolase [Chloroflexi bacterium]|nr:M20/M25/M40 family metallo-hydrolase [Chloroflexota bacterium]